MLDLGCGYGWHCAYAVSRGAEEALGIDLSSRMIGEAGKRSGDPKITYRVCALEEYDYPEAAWDCVVSNLALHYIADLDEIFRKVFRTLKPGGTFLFNMEHPVFTARRGTGMDLRRRRKASVLACGRLFLSGRTENELSWLSGHETAPYTDPDHVWSAGRRLYCPGSGRGGAVRGDDGDSGDGG